jgi:hypothetical protein
MAGDREWKVKGEVTQTKKKQRARREQQVPEENKSAQSSKDFAKRNCRLKRSNTAKQTRRKTGEWSTCES